MTKIITPNEGNEYTNVSIINCSFLENEQNKIDTDKLVSMKCWIAHYDENGVGIGDDYETVNKISVPYHSVNTRYLSIAPNDSKNHINISLEKKNAPKNRDRFVDYPADCKIFERRLRNDQIFRGLVCKSEPQKYYDSRRILEIM